MKIIFSPKCLEYSKPNQPENPERVKQAWEFLRKKYEFVQPRTANKSDILKAHSREYVELFEKGGFKGDWETPNYPNIYEYAKLSAGAAIMAAKEKGFSLMRPPGHHVGINGRTSDASSLGFCYFNNMAVAVKNILEKYKKIAIIDFDCHFGNGTAEIFYKSGNVLFFSLHQWPQYPGTGWINEIGKGDGEGYTINMPLPRNTGDDIYIDVLNKIVPIIKNQFKPNMIAISAGFDSYKSDPITSMNLSTNSFYKIGKSISDNFKKFFCCLEGGYDTVNLPICIYSFIKGLDKDNYEKYEKSTKSSKYLWEQYRKRFNDLKNTLSDYWEFQ